MTKLGQLQHLRQVGIPCPKFIEVRSDQLSEFDSNPSKFPLSFPVAVRSSYSEEDGQTKSWAGAFKSKLNVSNPAALSAAMEEVFDSYPQREGQSLIIQEMIQPDYSGVLFAYPDAIWKCELAPGLGENVVASKMKSESILLPKFGRDDRFFSRIYSFWSPRISSEAYRKLSARALIRLASYAQKLLKNSAEVGLDIEFAIRGSKLWILQARPISTPEDREEILSSANHKEILPPQPSVFMNHLITNSAQDLFAYYQKLDPSLRTRDFIISSGRMPWINLSALLDMMTQWGLATSLVCQSVGAEDPYKVGWRPHRILQNLGVFWRVNQSQKQAPKNIKQWIQDFQARLENRQTQRRDLWSKQAAQAYALFWEDLRAWYVGLVEHMQGLTGAMSAPLALAKRLGYVHKLGEFASRSTQYLEAFQKVKSGQMTQSDFLSQFGHRGFYESDIGQARFREFSEAEWQSLMGPALPKTAPSDKKSKRPPFYLKNLVRLIHLREEIRHEAMRSLGSLRAEIQAVWAKYHAQSSELKAFSDYSPADLEAFFSGKISLEDLAQVQYPEAVGWDWNTFLVNQADRRIPLDFLANIQGQKDAKKGLGIYPGKIKGQVWRVHQADTQTRKKPDLVRPILVADTLDPGWIPYFLEVEGVLTYVGGLLSHASIILRESKIPSITQIPSHLELKTGDWIEMDAQNGEVKISQSLD